MGQVDAGDAGGARHLSRGQSHPRGSNDDGFDDFDLQTAVDTEFDRFRIVLFEAGFGIQANDSLSRIDPQIDRNAFGHGAVLTSVSKSKQAARFRIQGSAAKEASQGWGGHRNGHRKDGHDQD